MNRSPVSVRAKRHVWALLAVMALVASACSGTGADGLAGSDADPSPAEVQSPDPTENAVPSAAGVAVEGGAAEGFIANVTSADGSPIRWPEIDGEIGDGQGQVTGPAAPSGWYEVTAAGHATTYAKPVVTTGGYDILDVELTPLSSPIVVGTEPIEIDMDNGASIAVPAGALPTGTWLTVTELPARHLSAPWAPVDGGHRTRIFSFEASTDDGSDVQPTASLTLRLDDPGSLGGVSALATFDSDAGRWVTSGECTESGAAVECTVSHFSLSTAVGGQPYSSPPGPEGGSGGADADAQTRAEEAQRALDDGEENASEEIPARIESLLESAVSAARSAPSRATKDRLASMVVVANSYGLDTGAAISALGAAYEAVSSEVIDGAREAKKPRCEYFAPLSGVVAEGEILSSLGVSPSRQAAAVELLTEIEIECRYLWTGTIEYRFPAPERWEIYSAGPPALYEDRGIDEWVETVSVHMTVDPESGQLQGSASAAPNFVPLRFRIDLNTPAELCPGEYWEDFIVEGVGSGQALVGTGELPDLISRAASGAALIPFEFDGFYEAPRFSVSSPRPLGPSGIRVQTQIDVHSFIVPCENISESFVDEEDVLEPYMPQLIEGFGFLSPVEPRVTLNEMLNSSSRTLPDGTIVIEGRRELSVGMDLIVPFQEGTVTWRFMTESVFEGYGSSD